MSISNAVGSEVLTRIIGYQLKGADFSETSPNLPQRIAVLTEVAEAKQSAITADVGVQITSAPQAGNLFGCGSMAHMVARLLFPQNGGGSIGGIPVYFYPQAKASGAAARVATITITGPATAAGTHYVKVAGRTSVDGVAYAVNIASGATATTVGNAIRDAINAVPNSPVTATANTGVVTVTTKWNGLTSNDITLGMDTNGTSLGLTYVVAEDTAGTGTPSIATALTNFGAAWNTIVINTYGTVSTIMDALEAANGIPDPTNPSGRYLGTIFKPFVALTGSVADDPSSTTDSRKANCTIAICPAPGSLGHPAEAAANMACLFARCAQDTPELDVAGSFYPDMPTPDTIGSMASYVNRDAFLKKGCSTVDLVDGRYQVEDFITTYHPTGEVPPQFRYCRNLMLDFNVRFTYYLKEQLYVVGHVIAADADIVRVSKVVKPKSWKGVVKNMATELAERGLVADAAFMQDSVVVGISTSNPDRLETSFRYKRTGTARIASTTASAGFNFGKA